MNYQQEKINIDSSRVLRMGSFGFLFYGPCQYYWYGMLDRMFPLKTGDHFLAKVLYPKLNLLLAVQKLCSFYWSSCILFIPTLGAGRVCLFQFRLLQFTLLTVGSSQSACTWPSGCNGCFFMDTCSTESSWLDSSEGAKWPSANLVYRYD